MANVTDEDAPAAWYLRAGRVVGAGLTGAVVGASVAGIWHAGVEGAQDACRNSHGFCMGIVPGAEAIAGNVLVIAAGVFVGFAVLRIRPLRLTIPLGCILAAMLTAAIGVGIPGDYAPAPWETAVAAGAGLAALALSFDRGRPQVAGLIALPVILLATLVLPHVSSSHSQADTWERKPPSPGVPLLLPARPLASLGL